MRRTDGHVAERTRTLAERYREIRRISERLCSPLAIEDYVVQSMPDVSPTRWHLAHVTWFFETFVLKAERDDYAPLDRAYEYLFNSYYNAVGEQFPRPRRGLLTRPTVREVFDYRAHVDEAVLDLLGEDARLTGELRGVIELGLHHEQQHQELMLMDIKHVFSCNPLHPVYRDSDAGGSISSTPSRWLEYPGGVRPMGHAGDSFAYDNEGPRHEHLLRPFRLASRPVTNGDFLDFIKDGGYDRSEIWLADGWTTRHDEGWSAPLYWRRLEGVWHEFTLSGLRPLDEHAPVCHVSYFEADAYATWAGSRLPTEFEWETVAMECDVDGNFVDDDVLHPTATRVDSDGPTQIFGDVWEWTQSAYAPYPGYRPAAGALGEYNGKFMCNQFVLRGGSCVTPRSHIRATYRNFFYPHQRWQFAGFRLADDA